MLIIMDTEIVMFITDSADAAAFTISSSLILSVEHSRHQRQLSFTCQNCGVTETTVVTAHVLQ